MLGLVALLGCADKAAEAEKQFEMVERSSGTPDERCSRKWAVAEPYLEAGNEEKYEFADLMADSECLNGELKARLGL